MNICKKSKNKLHTKQYVYVPIPDFHPFNILNDTVELQQREECGVIKDNGNIQEAVYKSHP